MLLFLVLLLNVKLVVKLAALVLLFFARPNFRFGLRLQHTRLPLFYPLVILLALLNAFLYQTFFQLNYNVVLLFGLGLWFACLLASHQLKRVIETTDVYVIHRTLIVFFLLNTFVSAFQFVSIVLETGAINPFRYQGNYQKYFISTGDYIKGLSFDTSTTNAAINAFGAVYFFEKRSWLMLLVCTTTLLFTGSNLANVLLYFTFFMLFLFRSSREQKSFLVICVALLVVFVTKISPQNNQYVANVMEEAFHLLPATQQKQKPQTDVRYLPDEQLTTVQRKEKISKLYLDSLRLAIAKRIEQHSPAFATYLWSAEKQVIPEPNIHSAPFQNRDDTNVYRRELLAFIAGNSQYQFLDSHYAHSSLPGKLMATRQTSHYLRQHPLYFFTGTGLGNFSSKVAFKATALQVAGGFPQQLAYIHPSFAANHLSLYIYFFSKRANAHSIINTPNSVYDQLLSEYGLVGFIGFIVLYVGFFARHYQRLTYGIPLLALLLGFFFMDYWFEQLSIVVLFELLLFLNLKETVHT